MKVKTVVTLEEDENLEDLFFEVFKNYQRFKT